MAIFVLLLTSAIVGRSDAQPAVETADLDVRRPVGEVKIELPGDIQRIVAAGRENNQVMAHLDYLTNRIGPRLTSSDNLTNACEWTRDTFASFGLENAHLEKWAEWPVGFNRGPWFGKMVSPEVMALEINTDAWSAGTKGRQRGPAILAPTNDDELAAVKDRLAGAWVMTGAGGGGRGGRGARGRGRGDAAAAGGNRGERAPAADAQAATEQPRGGRRGAQRGEGGRRGGAANDPIRQRLQDAYREAGILGTIVRRNSDVLVTSGRRPTSMDFMNNLPTTPQINMGATSYDSILKHVRAGEDVTLEFDIRNYFKKGPIPLYNVVADIPGSELPNEYVIVGGHIDSWDGATGATDNGTGVATALEAARILMAANVKPKRTIRFMLWSGEEQGILGSRAYVRANRELMPKISAVLVHDLGTQYLSSISGLVYQLADLKEAFAPVMMLDSEMSFKVLPTDSLTSLGSDHRSFVSEGVPAFFWGQSGGGFNYWTSHHSQFDSYEIAEPKYQEHSSIVIALAAYGIANLDRMIPREEGGN